MFKLIVSFGVMSCMGFSSKIENLIEPLLPIISTLSCRSQDPKFQKAEPVTPVL